MVRGLAVLVRSFVFMLLILSLGAASGCDSLSEFGGDFSGAIVEGSFVRNCFDAEVKAELRFKPSSAVGSTRGLSDEERNWLTLRAQNGDVVFDAPLEPIYAITSDTLADFDFPGQKRLRSYMLLARSSTGSLAGRDVVVVVSLLATKKIELRVMARASDDDTSCTVDEVAEGDEDAGVEMPRYPQYYGLFKLSK